MIKLSEQIKAEIKASLDPDYKKFHAALLPGVEDIQGVRVPKLRDIAKRAAKADWRGYLAENHDDTYEERMIWGMIIGYAKMELEERKVFLDAFVPKIDNWAVCDCCTSTYKFMKKDQQEWFGYLMGQIRRGTEYSIRFGVVALMDYYVAEEWIDRVLEIYGGITHDGYYVKMAVAWGISMCYIKFPDKTRRLLEKNNMDDFTQNKAIQKIRESYRVPKEDKEDLIEIRRKNGKESLPQHVPSKRIPVTHR